MLIKGLLNFDLELLKCWPKVFSISIWNCWNVDQRSSLLRSEIAQSQSWWKATKGLLNLGTWRKAIKGLLYFNLDLLKCRSKVFSTSIWSCWNVHQRSSLLRSGLVEMWTNVFSTSIWTCWNVNQRSSLIWTCWNVDQRSSLLRSEIAQSQSWWKATKGLLNVGTWRKVIKGFLNLNLDLFTTKGQNLGLDFNDECFVVPLLLGWVILYLVLLDLNFIKKSLIDKRFYFWETFDFWNLEVSKLTFKMLGLWNFEILIWNLELEIWNFEILGFWKLRLEILILKSKVWIFLKSWKLKIWI